MITTGGNVPDISMAVALLDYVPPIASRVGRPRFRFPVLLADKGYDSKGFRPSAADEGPSRSSRNAAASTSKASAGCATSSNRASLCCTSSAAWPSAGNDTSIFMRPSSASAVPHLLATPDQIAKAEIVLGALILQRQLAECVASAFVVAEACLVLSSAAPA